ncbi:MAG: gliding motility protein GldC [Bacteroidetes bacterium]|nr:gliding motility protein GldC [Bacteroidota bacterium]MCH8233730.1 gliding motility protein GldC [Bacteroidota bacterium]
MKTSAINFTIELDDKNIPEKIRWNASDKKETETTNAIAISIWDNVKKNTMRIDLWTNEMPIDEMKRFHIDCIGGSAQSLLNATGDTYMSGEINKLCEKLVEHLKKELPGN